MYHKPIHHPLSSSSSQLCPIILQTNAYSMWMEITNRINGWNGKETLIKSIVEAVPTYAMMVFKIPINICKGMTDAHIVVVVGWLMMIRKGSIGKLGRNYVLQEIEVVWGLGTSIASIWLCWQNKSGDFSITLTLLCVRVLRAKYYPDGELLQAKMKSGSFFYLVECVSGIGLL